MKRIILFLVLITATLFLAVPAIAKDKGLISTGGNKLLLKRGGAKPLGLRLPPGNTKLERIKLDGKVKLDRSNVGKVKLGKIKLDRSNVGKVKLDKVKLGKVKLPASGGNNLLLKKK